MIVILVFLHLIGKQDKSFDVDDFFLFVSIEDFTVDLFDDLGRLLQVKKFLSIFWEDELD